MSQAEMQRGKAAHRQSDDVRLLFTEAVEHGEDIVGGASLGIRRDVLGYIGRREAARIESDRAIALAEVPQLRFEASDVAGELMHEDHRTAIAGLLEIQAYTIVRHRIGHRSPPSSVITLSSLQQRFNND